MDLFDYHRRELQKSEAPLAARMRPRTLDEFVGQEHIAGQGKLLRRAIETDKLFSSIILWGPPGTGKTTLAMIIANTTKSHFETISAVTAGVADIRRLIAEAKERRGMHGTRTIVLVDEIHRFNKAQQDALLPHVEDGTIILIGATTENPSFEVNAALLSRCRVFVLKRLEPEDIQQVIERALLDKERGLGAQKIKLPKDVIAELAVVADGDARIALNALEIVVKSGNLTLEGVRAALQRTHFLYDKTGEEHYNIISALHKSLRGSDADAALYWLGR
ncbi:MAG TPA: replication-associated recombination protein A, partial [Anaerolineae bacterium]